MRNCSGVSSEWNAHGLHTHVEKNNNQHTVLLRRNAWIYKVNAKCTFDYELAVHLHSTLPISIHGK